MATNDKYDRQLRLWGAEGQHALMSSHILLINAGPTGSETLKNLVLPGINRFTILDGNKVKKSDLGNNFFVTEDSCGKSRAKVVSELLVEMNPDVTGDFRDADPTSVIQNEPEYFLKFTLVIATQLPEVALKELARLCFTKKINLMVARSYGLIGYLRSVFPEHTIIDAKPDNSVADLRLSRPFPCLEKYASGIELSELPSNLHGHVPYVVILLQLIGKWKKEHNGSLPSTFDEKNKFKDLIKTASHGVWGHEMNFVEAYDNAFQAYVLPELPYGVQDILKKVKGMELTRQSHNFWILVRALSDFVDNEGEGLLPISGKIPDMTSTTEGYIELQKVYQQKAQRDIEHVQNHVAKILISLELPDERIPKEEISSFCKTAHTIEACAMRSIEQEYEAPNIEDVSVQLMTEPDAQAPILWYFLLRAADAFHDKNGYYPGELEHSHDHDAKVVKDIASLIMEGAGLDKSLITTDLAVELTRYGAAELHNIAALIGGMASQEAVKAITQQYTPLDNTYIFNGITGVAAVYQL